MAMNKTPVQWWLFLIPVFVVLFFYFLDQTFPLAPQAKEPEPLNPEWYTLTTARGTELENKSIVGNCFICHAYWVPIPRNEQISNPRFAHPDIVLDHGKNDRCYNCHLVSDRNKYVADDGSGIMSQLPEELCSRCHGLIYDDWLQGTHGKWTGMWKTVKSSDRSTYTCTQCHDPHDPAFRYKTIAPPPVWPDKYIRTVIEDGHTGPFANFLVGEEPKESF